MFYTKSNLSNTRKSVSSGIQTLRSGLIKREVVEFFLTNFELFGHLSTVFRVFDIASQSINNSQRNSKQKVSDFCDN